jgi:hypothetical protein
VQVGIDNGQLHPHRRRRAWECIWTLILPDGQITVRPFYDAKDSVMASMAVQRLLQARQMTSTAATTRAGFDFTYTSPPTPDRPGQ